MKTRLAAAASFLLSSSLLAAPVPTPSPSPTPGSFLLDEVVVTAHRRRTPLHETGSSISVLTAEDMQARQKINISEALRDLSALGVVETGGPGKATTAQIRGTGGERTLVLVDGAEMNDPMSTGRTFNFADLTVDNVERVEVLRGPQSTLYGPDASGGVIQVFTRRGAGPWKGSWTGESGDLGMWRTAFSCSGSMPNLEYSGGVSRWGMEGFSTAPSNHPGTAPFPNPYANNTYSANFGFPGKGPFRFDVSGRWCDSVGHIDNSYGLRDDPNHVFTSHVGSFRGEGSVDLWDKRVRLWAGATHTLDRFRDDNDPDMDHPEESLRSLYQGGTWRGDFLAEARCAPFSSFLAGFERKVESGESTYLSTSSYGAYQDDFGHKSAAVNGFYAEHHLSLDGRLHFWTGLRRDLHGTFGGHTTYRLSSSYLEKTSRLRFRASLGTGWKTPTLYQLYSSFGNPRLDPENNLAWDAGVDRAFGNGRAHFSAAYFENRFKDFLDFDNVSFVYLNIPSVKTRGAEMDASIRVSGTWTFRGSFTRTRAVNALTGDLLLRRPSYVLSAGAETRPARGLLLGFDAHFTGTRMDVVFPPWPDNAYDIPMAPYTICQARVSYAASGRMRLFGRCDNLFNRRYEEVLGYATERRSFFAGTEVYL